MKAYEIAKGRYAELGINTDLAIKKMEEVVISLHCWQADDVSGFEKPDASLGGGGIQVTGNYPGKARNIEELTADINLAMSLIPGKQKLNLHAIYGDFKGKFVERDQIDIEHFQYWIDWAKQHKTGLDFNATLFSHPLAESGFTLSNKDESTRLFWVNHVKKCRKIANAMGEQTGIPSVHNIWIPDGSKDVPVDRLGHRMLLKESLNDIFSDEYASKNLKDAVESKLFGIGSEAFVVGSHDFYMSYAAQNNKLICLDNGHFHPTEQVGDKISSALLFVPEILLHVTRGIRWDSDHVVTLNDEIMLIAQEIIRSGSLNRVHIGLDYFDASLNRIGAYVSGARATQMAFLQAMLEPTSLIRLYEENGKNYERMALLETQKSMPWQAVWDEYCNRNNVPLDNQIIRTIQQQEQKTNSSRGTIKQSESELVELVELSNFFGKKNDYVIAGGGNTSFKTNESIWVKASGTQLSDITKNGFVKLSRAKLALINGRKYSDDVAKREEEVKNDLYAAIEENPNNLRPSVETSMHDVIEAPLVVHTHPTLVNALMCNFKAKELAMLVSPDSLFIEYTDPGYILFKKVQESIENYKKTKGIAPAIIFLENHGVFISGNDSSEIITLYGKIENAIHQLVNEKLVNERVLPDSKFIGLAKYLSTELNLSVIATSSSIIQKYIGSAESFNRLKFPFTPDIIVYCKSKYLFIENTSDIINAVNDFKIKNGYMPKIIGVKDLGLLALEDNESTARKSAKVFEDMMLIHFYASQLGEPKFMNEREISFIDNWEVENYRRKVSKA